MAATGVMVVPWLVTGAGRSVVPSVSMTCRWLSFSWPKKPLKASATPSLAAATVAIHSTAAMAAASIMRVMRRMGRVP